MSKRLWGAGLSSAHSAFLSVALASLFLVLVAPAAEAARTAAIIVEADSGAVLYEDQADAPRYPASLTKMMTLYMLFEAIDAKRLGFGTRLPVSARAAAQSPTKLGLEAGETITVRDVILGLITKSANDAAVVAAEALGGSEERFAQMMTEKARRLGMVNTTFRNASGLPDPRQVTTARDLATLARALVRTYPHHYAFFSTAEFTYNGRVHANHNRLNTWYEGADGIKTGYIRASGFNLATSAMRNNRRLVGVVMGGVSPGGRDQEMARLLDAAFARPKGADPVIREARATKTEAKTRRAAAAPAAKTRTTAASRSDGWGIQIGAYTEAAPARRAAQRAAKAAPRQLAGASMDIAPLETRKGSLYRARLIGVSEAEARAACRTLGRKKMDCITLPPSDVRGVRIATADN